jgi:hypothetical protein
MSSLRPQPDDFWLWLNTEGYRRNLQLQEIFLSKSPQEAHHSLVETMAQASGWEQLCALRSHAQHKLPTGTVFDAFEFVGKHLKTVYLMIEFLYLSNMPCEICLQRFHL